MDDSTGLLLEIRDENLVRVAQIDLADILTLDLHPKNLAVGSWSISLPGEHPAAGMLRTPGWGLLATLRDQFFLSGPVTAPVDDFAANTPLGTATITGVDDNVYLDDALAWPSPATTDLEAQDGTAGSGYDERAGVFETVARAYVNANIGPAAPAARRRPFLELAPNQGRGGTVTGSARFEKLGELLSSLSKAGGNLGFRVRQDDLRLLLEFSAPADRSALVRFDLDNDTLVTLSHSRTAPTATVAIVMGAGEDSARILQAVTTNDSIAAQAEWGRRIERTVDQQSLVDVDEITQAGVESLKDDGKTVDSLTVELIDTDSCQFGRDYRLGDRVTVVVPGVGEIADVISEAVLTFGPKGYQTKAVIGDPSAAIRDPAVRARRDTTMQARRVSALERRR